MVLNNRITLDERRRWLIIILVCRISNTMYGAQGLSRTQHPVDKDIKPLNSYTKVFFHCTMLLSDIEICTIYFLYNK